MAHITSDNPEASKTLQELQELVIENGGHIHPDINFVVNNNSLSIESPLNASNQDHLLYIPDACLPCYDDFDITLKNNEIAISPKNQSIPQSQQQAFNLLITLFNLTKKLDEHRENFPGLLQPLPEEIIELLGKKDPSAKTQLSPPGKTAEQHLLDSFFHTRYLSSVRQNGERKRVLLPMIDFINHNANALPFTTARADSGNFMGIIVCHWKDSDSSRECFVDYYPLDPMARFLGYGFVDTSANYIQSIPLSIVIESVGCLHINNKLPKPEEQNKLPTFEAFSKIDNYQPYVQIDQSGNLTLSHLAIPIKDDETKHLNPAIKHAIQMMSGKKLKGKKLERLAQKAQKTLIRENIKYSQNAYKYLENRDNSDLTESALSTLQQLFQFEHQQLSKYLKS
ncbi:hypothetical protein [Oceanicoccus sagamiensis]|uniref:SET domain-containing protein n=1 Tax=Oceanicoccus sagamiensis TaxID=716816 RepID=A0A1X9NL42_9GAMM|nr:hypothetical protein [Oceanicoccus sagamiensis]ARN76139.1 hypothetical protein BST96_19775 [Oceanicoccus sagamiensis]